MCLSNNNDKYMNQTSIRSAGSALLCLVLAACGGGSSSSPASPDLAAAGNTVIAPAFESLNTGGAAATWAAGGHIDIGNPFYRPTGNGRSCASCHSPNEGWSLTPASVQSRFAMSNGGDALFLAHDGANSPNANVSSQAARASAYSMLLSKAVIRIGMPMPAGEFELAAVDDPYGFAGPAELSLFRRPLPATNLRFVSNVMWDGRETPVDANSSLCVVLYATCYASARTSLLTQAATATRNHHQFAAGHTPADLDAIVKLETGLFSAQTRSATAGDLTGAGARGGPGQLAQTAFYFGINDFDSGDYQTGAPFTTRVFTTFDAWAGTEGTLADPDTPPAEVAALTAARRSVARGQAIFNGRPMFINNVPGMRSASVRGSCASCHNAPNVGSSSTPLLVNIGTADGTRRSSDLPLYTLRNKQSGQTLQVTDPGAGLVSGRWDDIGKFKVPVLRGLAARPPYFHNGSAASLRDVVVFYNDRFQMALTQQDIADLVAFLSAL